MCVALALGLARSAGALLDPPPAITVDPVLPIAGEPLRVLVDFQAAGWANWCHWASDSREGLPRLEALGYGSFVVYLWYDHSGAPPPSCPQDVLRHPHAFEIPAGFLYEHLDLVEVRRRLDYEGRYEVVARSWVRAQSATAPVLLQDDGFEVAMSFVDPRDGTRHPARGVRLSGESAAFWFFDGRNAEVVVKLLDGTPVNRHFWLFASSLTTVEYDLRIEDRRGRCGQADTAPCRVREYHQAGGDSRGVADVEAFPSEVSVP